MKVFVATAVLSLLFVVISFSCALFAGETTIVREWFYAASVGSGALAVVSSFALLFFAAEAFS